MELEEPVCFRTAIEEESILREPEFTRSDEEEASTKTNIMMQSALRVSYTSPKVMHWITKLLIWLSEADCKNIKNDAITKFDKVAENIAIDAVRENFFQVCSNGVYAMGVNTPHIVFNYGLLAVE